MEKNAPDKNAILRGTACVQIGALPEERVRIQPSEEEVKTMIHGVTVEAAGWAKRNGFQEPIVVDGEAKVDYHWTGWGYKAAVSETLGKKRRADLVFTKEGKPSMWTAAGATLG